MKPSVYSLKDFEGIVKKNKLDVLQILRRMNNPLAPFIKGDGEDSLPLVYETDKTLDISYSGMICLAKQKGIKAEVYLVQKTSARFVSLGKFDTATPATAKATNPRTKVTQFGAASYPFASLKGRLYHVAVFR